MSIPALPPGLQPEDYEKIEAAVMETARGRWFLLEFARRQRAAETGRLAAAIERLEQRAGGVAGSKALSSEADSVSRGESASERSAAAFGERLQDFAWSQRERGLDSAVCAALEALAREAMGAGETVCEPEGAPIVERRADASLLAPPEPAPPIDPRLEALSRLDKIPLAERLELFS